MSAVYCFSATGHSLAVAEYFARELNAPLFEIGKISPGTDTAIVVFPVYCQNIPAPVKVFLPTLEAESVVLIATYGRMHQGNVLHEASKLVKGKIIAAAFVPTGHTYLNDDVPLDGSALRPILERIGQAREVNIPPVSKGLLACLFCGLRSRLGVRLLKNGACTACGACTRACPMNAMDCGRPNSRCIRCLRCVNICPNRALETKLHPFLRFYLRKIRRDEYIVYL